MTLELEHPRLTGWVSTSHQQSGALELGLIRRVDAVAAMVFLVELGRAAQLCRPGARSQSNRSGALDQRTGERGDDGQCGGGVDLGMVGGGPAEDGAGVLERGVLESPTGAEKRGAAHTGMPDRAKGTGSAGVRACGNAPDTVVGGEKIVDGIGNRGGVKPGRLYLETRGACGELESERNRPVSGDRRIVVTDQGDANAGGRPRRSGRSAPTPRNSKCSSGSTRSAAGASAISCSIRLARTASAIRAAGAHSPGVRPGYRWANSGRRRASRMA